MLGVQIGRAEGVPPSPPATPAMDSEGMTEPQLRASLSLLESLRQALLGMRANGSLTQLEGIRARAMQRDAEDLKARC